MPLKRVDYNGVRFGKLMVIGDAPNGHRGKRRLEVVCDCGTSKAMLLQSLTRRDNPTCGCGVKEARIDACTKHGASHTAQYHAYQCMLARTRNTSSKDYPDYGGRGVAVCESWAASYENFLLDMGPRPEGASLGRIDNDGPYCKENCRWENKSQQARNKRNNKLVDWFGQKLPLVTVIEESGGPAHYRLVSKRLNTLGWSLAKALWTPSRAAA